MLPFAPLSPIDFKSSWDGLLVAVADILSASDPMLTSLLITQACIPHTGSEAEEQAIKRLKQLCVCRKSAEENQALEEQTRSWSSQFFLCGEATAGYTKGRLKCAILTAEFLEQPQPGGSGEPGTAEPPGKACTTGFT